MKRFLLSLSMTVSLFLTQGLSAQDTDFHAILAQVDTQSTFPGDTSAKVTIVSKKAGKADNIMQAQFFRNDTEKKTVILMLKPEVNKGQGYLEIGNNMIFYDPESRKFSKISTSGNFQDSNAKNSDFEPSALATNYTVVESARDALQTKDVWVLTLSGKRDDLTYPKRKVWVEVSTNLLLKSEDYSLSDRLMRTSLYGKYVNLDGRFLACKMRFEDNIKKGEVTDMVIENPSTAPLPPSIFSQSFLEKVNH